ncbi:NAD(P)/FAD-dependent oxidoreductase [Williamsia sp. CHRR-6]|uniref:flavin-containing monooxygenase n=1 Tax=Williamsia sp. CHRR-6 TaxID=2835871 RepID=UPI001BD9EF77|nr:NAD(P)/FAD-dependent oxidoreductase [Williamsia sp. CHRR-6]MBT0567250.1 NAD(P)/FAD-dependent oxidoreductase [Williamsia sp. CHRR-6]
MTETSVAPAVPESTPTPHIDVAIIGSGFGGLGAAIRLTQEGRGDFLVFERNSGLGGTWHVNTYPGAQCDIPSALYSFSFAPNPNWTRLYPLQDEIEQYLNDCADQFDVRHKIRFGHDVHSTSWDDATARWTVVTSQGTWTARVLIAALGPFSEPAVPDIAGLDTFAGTVFHSAKWDHDHDLTGERVGVIGTGASAVQFVPHVAAIAGHLTLFQRTPTWIMPHPDRPVAPALRRIFAKAPVTQRGLRSLCNLAQEALVPGLVRWPGLLKSAAVVARMHIRRQVSDPQLREKLTPTYSFGCKRPTFSNKFYPALTRPNVTVETTGIRSVRPTGIETVDGTLHELDTIVLGTGFAVAKHPGFGLIHGRGGKSLAAVWPNGEMHSYRGTTVPGFPNLFILLGPNSVVYTSQVVTIEAQVQHIVSALDEMDARGVDAVEVTEAAEHEFVHHTDEVLSHSVWNTGGCSSYYLSPSGRNFTYWPGSVRNFTKVMSTIDMNHYTVETSVSAADRAATPGPGSPAVSAGPAVPR